MTDVRLRIGMVDILLTGETALTSAITALPTPRHTPGHMSVLITSGGEQALIAGDAVEGSVFMSEPGAISLSRATDALCGSTAAATGRPFKRPQQRGVRGEHHKGHRAADCPGRCSALAAPKVALYNPVQHHRCWPKDGRYALPVVRAGQSRGRTVL